MNSWEVKCDFVECTLQSRVEIGRTASPRDEIAVTADIVTNSGPV